MENNASRTPHKIIASIAVLLVIVLTVFGVKAFDNEKLEANNSVPTQSVATNTTQQTPSPASTDTTTQPAQSATTVATTTFNDGTYETTISYGTPGGTESMKVSITLSGDAVTSSNVISQASSRDSREYQSAFINSYKSRVTGKSLKDLSLSRVSGASLTTQGFNDALDQIRNKAAA